MKTKREEREREKGRIRRVRKIGFEVCEDNDREKHRGFYQNTNTFRE